MIKLQYLTWLVWLVLEGFWSLIRFGDQLANPLNQLDSRDGLN